MENSIIIEKSLTLEELLALEKRVAKGEKILIYCTPMNDFAKVFKYGIMFFGTDDYCSWDEIKENYGKLWEAYVYPPVYIKSPCQACGYGGKHLDAPPCTTCPAHPKGPSNIGQEKWEPCVMCKSCTNCWFCMNSKTGRPCADCDEYSKFNPVSYCRYCGRPLTGKAWEQLEKRLRRVQV